MPLESGASPGAISRNISELHTGKTFKKTKKKFGKKRAHKQSIAIAMSKAREMPDAGHNPPKPTHAHPGGIPRHLRGRGLISAKAMEAAGHKQATRSHRAPGPQVASAGKSHAAHGDAPAARPWHGKKYTAKGKPPKGPEDAAGAHHD